MALALAFAPWCAEAAGLGKLTVLSALGEPLRAEIDLTANNDEFVSMAARLASLDAFKNAGIEYAPTLTGIRFAIERRANGQAFVAVKSERPLSDPFIDMLVEVNWASGRLVREYTFLLDPPEVFKSPTLAVAPEVRKEAVPAPAAPEVKKETAPAPAMPEARKEALPPAPPAERKPAPVAAKAAEKPAEKPAAKEAATEATRTVVKGDTLGKIALEMRPEGVSLDRMLVALFRSNPDAFAGGNMNRLRAGKILGMPDKDAIAAVDAGEARKIVVAQFADFNAYRKKLATLAAAAPARAEAPQQQAAAGKIAPRVEDKASPVPPAGKDKLEVSRTEAAKGGKPGVQAPGRTLGAEDIVARDKALKDAKTRIAALEKNLSDLRKLAELRSAAGAKLQEAAKPGAPAAKNAEPPAVPAVVPVKPAEAPQPIDAPKPIEAPPASDAPKPAAPPPLPPPPPPSFVEDNPGLVFGGAGMLALLLGYFGYKARRNKRLAAAGPASVAPTEPTASIFGATGGQSVDTGASLPTDFSQDSVTGLATDEGVDPVAEADVYMAYGRDRQAEEILLEALKSEPTRAAIHLKLLEIYAARKSVGQFEAVARELNALTGGSGPDWEKAAKLGRSVDPANPLYGGAAAPAPAEPATGASAGMETTIMPAAMAQMAAEAPTETDAPAVADAAADDETPLSLDFDLDAGEAPAVAPPVAADEPAADEAMSLDFDLDLGAAPAEPAAETEAEAASIDFDVGMPAAETEAPQPEAVAVPAEEAQDDAKAAALDFEFDLGEVETPAEPAEASAEAPAEQAGIRPLDLSDISLELGEAPAAEAAEAPAAELPAIELPSVEPSSGELPPVEPPPVELPPAEPPPAEPPPAELPPAELPPAELPPAESPAAAAPGTDLAEPALAELAAVEALAVDDPEVATKLELAQAYEEMGDKEGARELLNEVLNEGSPAQQAAARAKLAQLG